MHAKLTPLLICLSTLVLSAGCATQKPITSVVAREVVKYQYVPIPAELLPVRCADVRLSDVLTRAQMEASLVQLWTCAQDSNADKQAVKELKAP